MKPPCQNCPGARDLPANCPRVVEMQGRLIGHAARAIALVQESQQRPPRPRPNLSLLPAGGQDHQIKKRPRGSRGRAKKSDRIEAAAATTQQKGKLDSPSKESTIPIPIEATYMVLFVTVKTNVLDEVPAPVASVGGELSLVLGPVGAAVPDGESCK
ncbi:hypothetical protein N7474_008736 [Penicillium riverlandense]|uniref:uncharacterized protein n=1 Tax=Penicillium riverlandense TaxID=1903569 RepID=UPI002548A74E|nr:uncharacterized protein N7474_008736 [Penicillium riverlandense]KAJ5812435.1 hypothetical protein N7474_008736 [Penicillium riverlandense]